MKGPGMSPILQIYYYLWNKETRGSNNNNEIVVDKSNIQEMCNVLTHLFRGRMPIKVNRGRGGVNRRMFHLKYFMFVKMTPRCRIVRITFQEVSLAHPNEMVFFVFVFKRKSTFKPDTNGHSSWQVTLLLQTKISVRVPWIYVHCQNLWKITQGRREGGTHREGRVSHEKGIWVSGHVCNCPSISYWPDYWETLFGFYTRVD